MKEAYPDQLVMEQTPTYFEMSDYIPQRVYNYKRDIKLILIIKEPVFRLHSHYIHNKELRRNHAKETRETFEEVVFQKGTKVIDESYIPIQISLYYKHFQRWLQYFNKNQFFIVDGNDFAKNPLYWLQSIERFLGLSEYFKQKHFTFNSRRGFYCLRELGCMSKGKGRKHPKLNQTTEQALQEYFKVPNEKLKQVTGVNFTWL